MPSGKVFGIIGVVVGVLIIATLAIPIVDEVAYFDREYRDNTQTTLYELDADSAVLSMTSSGLTIDGETVPVPNYSYVMLTDAITVHSGNTVYKVTLMSEGSLLSLDFASGDVITMTGTRYTATIGGQEYSGSYASRLTILDAEGTYVSNSNYATTAYLANSGARFVVGSVGTLAYSTGTLGASTTADGDPDIPGKFSWSSSRTDGVYTIENVRWYADGASEDGVAAYMFVPQEFYVLIEVDGDETQKHLLSVVPLLLIVGVLMLAVRLLAGRD